MSAPTPGPWELVHFAGASEIFGRSQHRPESIEEGELEAAQAAAKAAIAKARGAP